MSMQAAYFVIGVFRWSIQIEYAGCILDNLFCGLGFSASVVSGDRQIHCVGMVVVVHCIDKKKQHTLVVCIA